MIRFKLALAVVCSLATAGCDRSAKEELQGADEAPATANERSAEAQRKGNQGALAAQRDAREVEKVAAAERAEV